MTSKQTKDIFEMQYLLLFLEDELQRREAIAALHSGIERLEELLIAKYTSNYYHSDNYYHLPLQVYPEIFLPQIDYSLYPTGK